MIKKYFFISFSKLLPILFSVLLVPLANLYFDRTEFTYFTSAYLLFNLLASLDFGFGSYLLGRLGDPLGMRLEFYRSIFCIIFAFFLVFILLVSGIFEFPAFERTFGILVFFSGLSQVVYNLILSIFNIKYSIIYSTIFNFFNVVLKIIASYLSIVLFREVEFLFFSIAFINILFCLYYFIKVDRERVNVRLQSSLLVTKKIIPFFMMFVVSYLNSNYVKILLEHRDSYLFSIFSILSSLSVAYTLLQSIIAVIVLKAIQKNLAQSVEILMWFLFLSIVISLVSFLCLTIVDAENWFGIFKQNQLEFARIIYPIVFSTASLYSLQIVFYQVSIYSGNVRTYLKFSYFFALINVPIFYCLISWFNVKDALIYDFYIVAVSTILLNFMALKKLSGVENLRVKRVYFPIIFLFFLNCLVFVHASITWLFASITVSLFILWFLFILSKMQIKILKVVHEF